MKKLIIIIMCCLALPLSGCEKIQYRSDSDEYDTQYAMSAVEYNIFLNEEIGVVENELMTRVIISREIPDDYERSKEIQNTEESILKVKEIEERVTKTMPATNYESDRQNTIDLIEDARLALEGYREKLENGSASEIKACTEEMKNCYLALGGEANVYYQ